MTNKSVQLVCGGGDGDGVKVFRMKIYVVSDWIVSNRYNVQIVE